MCLHGQIVYIYYNDFLDVFTWSNCLYIYYNDLLDVFTWSNCLYIYYNDLLDVFTWSNCLYILQWPFRCVFMVKLFKYITMTF